MNRLMVVVVGLCASTGFSESFLARETAQVGKRWDYSVGVFGPLQLGIADGVELRTHPLFFFVSPNLDVRVAHIRNETFSLAGEYGFSIPTPALRLTQGFLFPTEGKNLHWAVVPHAGARASFGKTDGNVFTVLADVAVGVPLGRNELTPMGAWPFLEVALAPYITGFRGQVGALYDYKWSDRLRLRGYADAYFHRAAPSVLTLRGGLNVDIRVGKMSRLSVGGVWWNADQQAIDETTLERVRSNDFLPTIDFIWAG